MRSPRLLGLLAVALPAVGAAAVLLPHSPAGLRELVVELGPAAPAIALGAWIVLTPALFPGSALAAAGGLAFGVLGGSALAFAGALAGGLAAFALARTAARGPAERLIARNRKLASIDSLLARRGFEAILVSRLMPGVPATALHYAAGASQVRARAFAAAIAVGALLRTVPYALLGTGLASGSSLTLLVAGGTIALGAVTAAGLARHIRLAG